MFPSVYLSIFSLAGMYQSWNLVRFFCYAIYASGRAENLGLNIENILKVNFCWCFEFGIVDRHHFRQSASHTGWLVLAVPVLYKTVFGLFVTFEFSVFLCISKLFKKLQSASASMEQRIVGLGSRCVTRLVLRQQKPAITHWDKYQAGQIRISGFFSIVLETLEVQLQTRRIG